MIDDILRPKQSGDRKSKRQIIRDIVARKGAVQKKSKTNIPVTEATEEAASEPLHAYMIDEKYLPDKISALSKVDQPASPRPHPPVLQYSRITRPDAPVRAEAEEMTVPASLMLATPSGIWADKAVDKFAMNDNIQQFTDEAKSWLDKVKELFVAFSDKVSSLNQRRWFVVPPIAYSYRKNAKKQWYALPVVPVFAGALVSVAALYGVMSTGGAPASDPEFNSGSQIAAPESNGASQSNFSAGSSDDNPDNPQKDQASNVKPGSYSTYDPATQAASANPSDTNGDGMLNEATGNAPASQVTSPSGSQSSTGGAVDEVIDNSPVPPESGGGSEDELLNLPEVTVPSLELGTEDTQLITTPEIKVGL